MRRGLLEQEATSWTNRQQKSAMPFFNVRDLGTIPEGQFGIPAAFVDSWAEFDGLGEVVITSAGRAAWAAANCCGVEGHLLEFLS